MARLETEVALLKDVIKVLQNEKNAIGWEVLTITTNALSLAAIPSGAVSAEFQVESTNATDAVRYRLDGGAPTSTVGIVQGNGSYIEITTSENIRNFKIIKGAGGGTTTINVTYFK
jgi:hypothetical protein